MDYDLDKVGDSARAVIADLTHFHDPASAEEQWMRRAAEYCRWPWQREYTETGMYTRGISFQSDLDHGWDGVGCGTMKPVKRLEKKYTQQKVYLAESVAG